MRNTWAELYDADTGALERQMPVGKRLVPMLSSVAEAGVGVLLIEQFAHVALGLANTAYVLEGGRVRYHGTAAELRDDPDILRSAYLLRERPR